jgi:hypothetical protein
MCRQFDHDASHSAGTRLTLGVTNVIISITNCQASQPLLPLQLLRKLQGATSDNQPKLIGVMHGLWPFSDAARESVNSGIAVITPADAILHVLNQDHFVKQRAAEKERIIASFGTTVETGKDPATQS